MPPEAATALLRACFRAAIDAADPATVLARHLPDRPSGRVVVLGAGKAAASMAAALEAAWPDGSLDGVVVTRYGHAVPTRRIAVREAAHPVPDDAGVAAAREILAAAQGAAEGDLVLVLLSGGASALLAAPAPGISLADKQAVSRALLASGATITEMNTVRKHLSAVKGGRLAEAAAPARVVTLAISDVPGDSPAVIGSGPTVADPSRLEDARGILARYGIAPPSAVARRLADPAAETPKTLAADYRLIATPMMALQAAAAEARRRGVAPLILGDAIEGEAQVMGTVHAGIARSCRLHGAPAAPPVLLLSGGEATVTIGSRRDDSPCRGGRNTEFLLGLALALHGDAGTWGDTGTWGETGIWGDTGIWAIAGDSDGIDGSEDAAGAVVTPTTLARARAAGLDPRAVLDAHDSYGLFAALGDLVITGPTRTNVNDIRAILIAASG